MSSRRTLLAVAPLALLLLVSATRPGTLHGDQPACLAVAQAAFDAGHVETAQREVRAVLAGNPANEAAWTLMDTIAQRRGTPKDSETYRVTKALLPSTFRETTTSRYVVFSDADALWTRHMSSRLDRAHHQFHRVARRLGMRPMPLEHKLVCVLFADRDDYRAFAAEHDNVDSSWIAGYYAPAHDRIVFYDIESNPSVTRARSKLDEMQADADEIARQARRSGNGREDARDYQRHIESERRRVAEFAKRVNTATTVHEAVHQLFFHTGLQSRRVQYPLWLSEGLATTFETTDPGNAFGPAYEYAPRRERFEQLLEADVLMPLADLVVRTSLPTDGGADVEVLYQQSYALVTWMCRYRTEAFVRYLEAYRAETGSPPPARHLELFEDAFGPVKDLEWSWLRHESGRVMRNARAR